jgi:hypothetical protein
MTTIEPVASGPDRVDDARTAQILEGDLAQQLSTLARELQQEQDVDAVLDDIVQAALRLVPHIAHGSISLVSGRRTITSRAASSGLPRQVDALQSRTGQGPCLDAAYREQIVRVPDLANESRWPNFARGASELGATSMYSFQLFVQGDSLGALNLYGDGVDALDEESEQIALLIAAQAAVAFADTQKIKGLNSALIGRDLIGQAKGILMERFKMPAAQAFTLLTTVSMRTNRKLHDVALELTNTGELPAYTP